MSWGGCGRKRVPRRQLRAQGVSSCCPDGSRDGRTPIRSRGPAPGMRADNRAEADRIGPDAAERRRELCPASSRGLSRRTVPGITGACRLRAERDAAVRCREVSPGRQYGLLRRTVPGIPVVSRRRAATEERRRKLSRGLLRSLLRRINHPSIVDSRLRAAFAVAFCAPGESICLSSSMSFSTSALREPPGRMRSSASAMSAGLT